MSPFTVRVAPIAFLLVVSLLLSPLMRNADAATQATWTDTWMVFCSITDPVTNEHSCDLTYATTQPDNRPQAWSAIIFKRLENGQLAMSAGPTDGECSDKAVTLKIDTNSPVLLPLVSPGDLMVVGDVAVALVDQLLAGDQAILTIHLPPACEAQALPITLGGFKSAWKRFNAEMR